MISNYFNPDPVNPLFDKLKSNHELWNLFARQEEYNPKFLDEYDRFPHYKSNNQNILFPHVSDFLVNNGMKPQYPGNKKFALCLTHDIDAVNYKLLRVGKLYSQKKYTLSQALKMSLNKISNNHNFLWNFEDIMNIEEKHGGKSTFYFLALEKGDKDHTYDIIRLKGELKKIKARGWEVGLHGGHTAYNDFNQLIKEKKRLENALGRTVIGYRNHYIKFKIPETWELLQKAGFKYDTTLGFPGKVGFRNGMCHPFKPYNLDSGKKIDIIELPLNIMDGSFDEHMKLSMEESWQLSKQLIDAAAKYSGVLTLVWHNSYMINEWLELYEKILSYSNEKGAWLTSGEEIYKNAVGEY